jgi:flavin reductase (DIM6/NTAB) family NADH-FMN oxidoreductase RutF
MKINIGKQNFIYPMPVTLVGANVQGKANFAAIAWVNRICYEPPMVAIGLRSSRHTYKGIMENRSFSVCHPSVELLDKTDYCGIVSGSKVDKSALFKIFYGELKTAPMIEECPYCLECKLFTTVHLGTHELIVGEIVSAYTEEKFLTNGKPDIQKLRTFMLTMPDNNYWSIGEIAGKGWSNGKKLK